MHLQASKNSFKVSSGNLNHSHKSRTHFFASMFCKILVLEIKLLED